MVFHLKSVLFGVVLTALWVVGGCRTDGDQTSVRHAEAALQGTNPDSVGFVPDCNRGIKGLTCYLDTTYTATFPDEPNPVAAKNWLLFGTAGDSLELFSGAGSSISTSLGQEHDARNNSAGYFRHRLVTSGAITALIITNEGRGDSVEYYLRVRQEDSDRLAALRPTGERAVLTIEGRGRGARASVVPVSAAASVNDLAAWEIEPGRYNVALVSDSLYQVCRLLCQKPDTLRIAPATHVSWPVGRRTSRSP